MNKAHIITEHQYVYTIVWWGQRQEKLKLHHLRENGSTWCTACGSTSHLFSGQLQWITIQPPSPFSLSHTQTHSYIHIDMYFILLKNEEVVILKLEDELKSRYYALTLTKMKMKRLSEGKLNKCQTFIFTQSFSLTESKWMTVHSLKESSDRHGRWNEI